MKKASGKHENGSLRECCRWKYENGYNWESFRRKYEND
jgi:hypothetical protein